MTINQINNGPFVSILPSEIHSSISHWLGAKEIVRLQASCKDLNQIYASDYIWKMCLNQNLNNVSNVAQNLDCSSWKERYKKLILLSKFKKIGVEASNFNLYREDAIKHEKLYTNSNTETDRVFYQSVPCISQCLRTKEGYTVISKGKLERLASHLFILDPVGKQVYAEQFAVPINYILEVDSVKLASYLLREKKSAYVEKSRVILVALEDGSVELFDYSDSSFITKHRIMEPKGPEIQAKCLLITNEDKLVITYSDGTFTSWDFSTNPASSSVCLPAHMRSIDCVIQLKSGQLITGSQDATVRIWDPKTLQCLSTLEIGLPVRGFASVVEAMDSIYISASDNLGRNEVQVWNKESWERIYQEHFSKKVRAFVKTDDNAIFSLSESSGMALMLWPPSFSTFELSSPHSPFIIGNSRENERCRITCIAYNQGILTYGTNISSTGVINLRSEKDQKSIVAVEEKASLQPRKNPRKRLFAEPTNNISDKKPKSSPDSQ